VDQIAHCTHSPLRKEALIGSLQAAITKIEGHELCGGADCDRAAALWRLGCPAIDRLLPQGLDLGGVHEVKAAPHENGASAGDWMTGLGFALRLAVRRAMMARVHTQDAPWLLWCWPRSLAAEFGAPSAWGLAQLGLDPSRLLIVETARAAEALAALEDGLKSSSLGLAFGIFDEIALTPARRLSLVAATTGTPCLLVTHPAAAPSGATATRWRVGRHMSAPHAYDARAPGNARFRAGLERCRSQPESTQTRSQLVEWCDETRTFSLASGLAHRAADAGISRRRAKG
jgi:protein ImuA